MSGPEALVHHLVVAAPARTSCGAATSNVLSTPSWDETTCAECLSWHPGALSVDRDTEQAEIAALREEAERWRALAGRQHEALELYGTGLTPSGTKWCRGCGVSLPGEHSAGCWLADPDGAAALTEWTALRERAEAADAVYVAADKSLRARELLVAARHRLQAVEDAAANPSASEGTLALLDSRVRTAEREVAEARRKVEETEGTLVAAVALRRALEAEIS